MDIQKKIKESIRHLDMRIEEQQDTQVQACAQVQHVTYSPEAENKLSSLASVGKLKPHLTLQACMVPTEVTQG